MDAYQSFGYHLYIIDSQSTLETAMSKYVFPTTPTETQRSTLNDCETVLYFLI